MDATLADKFGSLAEEPEIKAECESLMRVYELSPEELFMKWEAYCVTNDLGVIKLSQPALQKLRAYMQDELERKQKARLEGSVNRGKLLPRARVGPGSHTGSPRPPGLSSGLPSGLPSTPMSMRHPNSSLSSLKRPHSDSPGIETPLRPSKRMSDLPSSSPSGPATPSGLSVISDASHVFGKVIESLNPNLPASDGLSSGNSDGVSDTPTDAETQLAVSFDSKKYNYRTMRQKLLDAADILDEQIDDFLQHVKDFYHLEFSDFGNPAVLSQNEIVAVGRIVPDSPDSANRGEPLTDSGVALESSRLSGLGLRIPLNFKFLRDAARGFSFFPGQIVALRGKNGSGNEFAVSEVLELPPLPAMVSSSSEILRTAELHAGKAVKIVVAAGPYTPVDCLDFSVLPRLVSELNSVVRPHVVVLMGPFIDITHPLISKGDFSSLAPSLRTLKTGQPVCTLDELFRVAIAAPLRNLDPRIKLVMIPSVRDACIKHAAFPQSGMDRRGLDLPKGAKCFPNPAVFSVNDVGIGASTLDVFADLKDTCAGREAQRNRFERIAEHVIAQRRFYPVFPGAVQSKVVPGCSNGKTEAAEGLVKPETPNGGKMDRSRDSSDSGDSSWEMYEPRAELDVPNLGLAQITGAVPDVLIMPSRLLHFVKVVKGVVVVNPGSIVKGKKAGTFATFTLRPPAVDDSDAAPRQDREEGDEKLYYHNVWKRMRVDLNKV